MDDFLIQGNAVCEEGNAALTSAGAGLDPTDQQSILSFVNDVLVPNLQGQIDALRALGYPDGDEQTLEAIYVDAEGVLDQAAADPTVVLSSEGAFADINTQLDDYGLTACAS